MESQASAMHEAWQQEGGDKDACGFGEAIMQGTSVLAGLNHLIEESEASEHGDYLIKAVEAGKAMDASHPASLATAARCEGVDFLLQITRFYEVSRETFGSCINVMDKFLSRACCITNCQIDRLFDDVGAMCRNPSLLSTTCFLVMCKYREIMCPLLQDLSAHLLKGQYTVGDIRTAENVLLTLIDWDIHNVTAVEICSVVMRAAPPIHRAGLQEEAELMTQIAACSGKMLGYSTASIAFCSMFLAAERLDISSERAHAFLSDCLPSRVNIDGGVDLLRSMVYSLEHQDDPRCQPGPPSAVIPPRALEPWSDEAFEAEPPVCPDAALYTESSGSITVTCELHPVIVVPASPESTRGYDSEAGESPA
jgi:hypothetical protein